MRAVRLPGEQPLHPVGGGAGRTRLGTADRKDQSRPRPLQHPAACLRDLRRAAPHRALAQPVQGPIAAPAQTVLLLPALLAAQNRPGLPVHGHPGTGPRPAERPLPRAAKPRAAPAGLLAGLVGGAGLPRHVHRPLFLRHHAAVGPVQPPALQLRADRFRRRVRPAHPAVLQRPRGVRGVPGAVFKALRPALQRKPELQPADHRGHQLHQPKPRRGDQPRARGRARPHQRHRPQPALPAGGI